MSDEVKRENEDVTEETLSKSTDDTPEEESQDSAQEVAEDAATNEEAEQPTVTDDDEFKTALNQPDSPLVVHKKGDASYKDVATANEMNETHSEEERPTLTRHRFRKEQKSHGKQIVLLIVIVILAAVFAALYVTGNITFGNKETTTEKKVTTTEATTTLQEKYAGTIVIKDTYIFVDGVEVDGIVGLQDALKYEDASTTAYKIIDEGANSDFLNFEVLKILEEMQFYGEDTEIEHIASTGLIADAETTTLPPETTTKKKSKNNKKKNKNKNSQQTTKKNG